MLHLWRVTSVVGASAILACEGGTRRGGSTSEQTEVHALLDSVAQAISARDARGIARRMLSDSSIVYVSDGHAIPGAALQATLQDFYATQGAIHFRWDSIRLTPVTEGVWTATSWAQIALTDTTGITASSRAIFTWTVVRRAGQWELALAHKTTLPRP